MEISDFLPNCKGINKFSKNAMRYAEKSHDVLFNNEGAYKIPCVIGYLNAANSNILTARSIYELIFNEGRSSDLENFFHQFETYHDEVMSNIETNHSHQWSDIEYLSLKKSFEKIHFM